MVKISEMMERPQVMFPGNMACAGCGLSLAYKTAISSVENPIVVIPACCASVIQSLHPNVTYNVPTLNIAFAAHAAAASGISRAKKTRGENITTFCWAGDGGTFDIGIATISGAAERNEDIIYCVYNNEFYGNTGSQRSSATPRGAYTTTTPGGKIERRKSIIRILAAHDVPYIATASVGYLRDLYDKVQKASQIRGFKFIHITTPCPTGWDHDPSLTIELGKLAVKTGWAPLFEIENGKLTWTRIGQKYREREKRTPLREFLKHQGRFKKLSDELLRELEDDIAFEWQALERLAD
ncbi:MAG: thiamine pyrophosphate-dependent enzyme [Candidatus Hodarchaeota archaeon]